MRTTTLPFDLLAWRRRMALTQAQAADALGLSLSGYAQAEYRATDRPNNPTNATVAKLAIMLERMVATYGAEP